MKYNINVPVNFGYGFGSEEALRELKRCGVPRAALGLGRELDGEYGFSTARTVEALKRDISLLKENGLEVIVWLGQTFGHDKSPIGDDRKSMYSNQWLIGQGRVTAFCPLDKDFKKRFCEWVAEIAKLAPDVILIDDDYRLNGGCVCELHMQGIREELGENISADELCARAFVGGRNRYRDAFIHSQGASMRELARAMRAAVDKINPKVRMGICATPFLWDCDGCDVVEIAELLAGGTRPFVRLFGAPYHAAIDGRLRLGTVIEHERSQMSWFGDSDAEVISEGDTWPQMRHVVPAAYLENFDTALRASGECSGIFKAMFNCIASGKYESRYADVCADNAELYRRIDKAFGDKSAVGVRPYLVPHIMQDAEMNGIKSLGICSGENILKCGGSNFNPSRGCGGNYNPSIELAVKNALPTSYEDGSVNIVFGENARHIPDAELEKGAIIDLVAAKILMERGIDVGIDEFLPDDGYRADIFGFFGYSANEDMLFKIGGATTPSALRLKRSAEIVNWWIGETGLDGKSGMGNRDMMFKYENANGQRFFVMPFDAFDVVGAEPSTFGYLDGYILRRELTKAVEWIGREPLAAYCETDSPFLYFMTKKNERGLAVGLWNLFEDKIENARVRINTKLSSVDYINCKGHVEGNTVVIDGIIYPYEFAGFEIKF